MCEPVPRLTVWLDAVITSTPTTLVKSAALCPPIMWNVRVVVPTVMVSVSLTALKQWAMLLAAAEAASVTTWMLSDGP